MEFAEKRQRVDRPSGPDQTPAALVEAWFGCAPPHRYLDVRVRAAPALRWIRPAAQPPAEQHNVRYQVFRVRYRPPRTLRVA